MKPLEIIILVAVAVAFLCAVIAIIVRKVKGKGCCDCCSKCSGCAKYTSAHPKKAEPPGREE